MFQRSGVGASALMVFLLGSTAVHAELTAEEVWQGMESYYADLGQEVSVGSKEMQGDTLVISDAVFAAKADENSFSATVPEIRLKELGDGRVELTMSDEIPLISLTQPKAGETVEMGMKITQSGLSVIASGSAEDTAYDFSATELALSADGVTVNGEAQPLKLNMALMGNSGSYRSVNSGGRAVTSDMTSDKIDFSFAGTDPKGSGDFSISGSMTGIAFNSIGFIPSGIDFADLNSALMAGFSSEGKVSYASGGYVMDFSDNGDPFSMQTTGGSGSLNFKMSKDGLAYGGEGSDTKLSLETSALPVPVDLSMGATAFNLVVPISKSDAEQPFGLLLKLADLELSDGVWSMFDPMAQLPRDPATVILDIAGGVKLLVNYLDPAEAETISNAPPGELQSLDINEVKLAAVGAELTGTGAMTFNNTMGMPMPNGAIDLQLVGGNALIDKLVAMGFVPEDQAMGARMMLGLFAVPSGEDTLTSKIEFKDDGGIYANGQRIK